jgi:hypothetical protein
LLQGDRGRDARRRNYGERVDGPWIVGMIDANRQITLLRSRPKREHHHSTHQISCQARYRKRT